MAKLPRLKKENLYEKVAEEIRDFIINNELKPGDRLPTERELVEQLGVSRSSVREGLRKLEILGILEVRPKEGITVKSQDIDVQPMVEKFTYRYKTNDVSFFELLEAREAIEEIIVKLAAQRANEEDLAEMRRWLNKMEEKFERGEYLASEDLKFHQAILAASKNAVLMEFGAILEEFFQETILAGSKASREQGPRRRTLEEHKELYESIKNKDAKRAIRVMRKHLEAIRDAVFQEDNGEDKVAEIEK